MAKYKVVMTDNIFPDLDIERKMLEEADAEFVLVPEGAELTDYVADADVVIDTYRKVTADVVDSMKKCKMVIRNGIGVDTIDMAACTKRNIMVANIPHYCSEEVATHTMALILASTRKLKLMNKTVEQGHWEAKRGAPMYSLSGKVLGLVGFGKIPRLIVDKARVFGMNVIAYDPYVSKEEMSSTFVEKVDFETLVRTSDILSIHCPLNEDTRNLINADVLHMMKPSAYLINVARGPIVNEQDLIQALESGEIAGAGLDLLAGNTAPERDNPLLQMDQVIVTPHCAWYSEESIVQRRMQTISNVLQVLAGGHPDHQCN